MSLPRLGHDLVTETALILYTDYLFGELHFGGPDAQEPPANIFIQEITGPFNRLTFTREAFSRWNP